MIPGPSAILEGRGCKLDLSRPRVMAVLNVTPDSFSDGGDYPGVESAFRRGLTLIAEGADLIDIGGESSRPGADPVTESEELDRVIPVITQLRNETDIPLSIDTTKNVVAREAVLAGVNYINDISGLKFDPAMADVAAETGAGLFLMHTRGTPREMQKCTDYKDLLTEVIAYLQQSIDMALAAGVSRQAIAVDPGIGFGKSIEGNLTLLRQLSALHQLGFPVLLGTSRKSFIGQILNQGDPRQRLAGTLATLALGVAKGVQLFRVHDVQEAKDAVLVAWAIREGMLP